MKPQTTSSRFDHYLVARAQALTNAANAHTVHALLGTYYGLCALADDDVAAQERCEAVELRLRVFCRTGSFVPRS